MCQLLLNNTADEDSDRNELKHAMVRALGYGHYAVQGPIKGYLERALDM